LQSIGGLDIFKSTFVDDSLHWSIPENLNLPINSAGDDTFFRLNSDGTKAFFSSQRKEGFGKRDIYSVVFKKEWEEQTTVSVPDLFFKVEAIASQKIAEEKEKIKVEPFITYNITPILYDKEGDIISAKNQKTLNALLAILKKSNETKIRLVSHTETNAGIALDAFLSIKRNEKLADYLIKEGIPSEKIELLGCGSVYSLALNNIDGEPNLAGQRFNRRIEPFFQKEDKLIKINIEEPSIPDYLQSGEYFRFKNINKGLSYRVRIATIKQMYSGDLIERYPDLMIEKNASENVYHYSLGLFTTFEQAERLRKDLELQGNASAQIIPYIAGWRLENTEEIKNNIAQYPDLQNFLNRKK
jgi:outer membrane protein OmpA-like peptidoglycan-associated protein